jgi:hypothetical protein
MLSAVLFLVTTFPVSVGGTKQATKFRRPPSPTFQDDTDPSDGPSQSNVPAILAAILMISVVGGIGFYVYLRRKWEEAVNPEYTRAILGDDAYEFTGLDTL